MLSYQVLPLRSSLDPLSYKSHNYFYYHSLLFCIKRHKVGLLCWAPASIAGRFCDSMASPLCPSVLLMLLGVLPVCRDRSPSTSYWTHILMLHSVGESRNEGKSPCTDACPCLTKMLLQNCGGTQGSDRPHTLPLCGHLYYCKLRWNCLQGLFVDLPSCLVTDVIESSKETVSLLPGSCSENLGHLLNGLLRFWSHGAAVLAGALLLCNSHVWKGLPLNVQNGKDRCNLGLILFLYFFPLISQELSCCCLSSIRVPEPLFYLIKQAQTHCSLKQATCLRAVTQDLWRI